MLVTVTQEDIDAGVRLNCYDCPIARAVCRATGRNFRVNLDDGEEATVTECYSGREGVTLPPECTAFVRAFDTSAPVAPFTFTLPAEAL